MNESNDTNAGKRLGGYEIIKKVGQGGMGAVFEAKQISMDRTVALKVLPLASPRIRHLSPVLTAKHVLQAVCNTPILLMFTTVAKPVNTTFLAWNLCPVKP